MLANKIESLLLRYKEEKLRNTIKSDILNGLGFIKKFIESSPGVISPIKVSEKMKEVEGYLKVWIKKPDLVEETKSIFSEITNRYIDISETKEDKNVITSVLDKKPIKDSILPWHTKRLFSEVDIRRQDVAYLPIGPCNHYCLVYKVVGDKTYIIPITTDVDAFDGYSIEKSRFFRGKAIFSLYQFPTSMVKDKFVLPYDHKSEANNIFKALEEFMTSILPKKRAKPKPSKIL